MKKFNAFTLAEVLITLGIIGVVAAMTMPTLINQTNGAQYKAAYKKALSAISQAVTLNVALEDESFADTVAGVAGSTETNGGTTVGSLLKSRMNVVDTKSTAGYTIADNAKVTITTVKCSVPNVPMENCTAEGGTLQETSEEKGLSEYFDTFLFFNDSSMFAFKSSDAKACTPSAPCTGLIDVNGAKGPNKESTCTVVALASGGKKCQDGTLKINDIYAVQFYDQRILPASTAGSEVLYGK